ncbi:hypothetical protein [Mycobacterium sp. E740]|uniref:hypothetical protein n=1 Tax=Mycobacterium sp. E740 TaxID=1834149 RepID=UPI000AC90ED5
MTRRYVGTGTITDLFACLGGVPALPGAACRGRHDLFDGETTADRIAAERLCRDACPALGACRRWVASLPKSRRPVGVVAGRFVDPVRR